MYKKVILINHDSRPILMLAYLMLFSALSNAVCFYDAFFSFLFAIDFCRRFLFSRFVLVY